MAIRLARAGKENNVETIMTDYQFRAILKMILRIVDKSDSKEEISKQISDILDEQKNKSSD